MTDIRTRLHEVERLDPPHDLWDRATEHDPEQPLRFEDPVASGWRRVAAIAAAFAVFGAAAFFGWRIWSPDTTSVNEPSPAPVTAPDPWAGLSAGFHAFSPPPVARVGPAIAWTDSELILWGGSLRDGADQFADGYVFDPASDLWTPMAVSPLGPRSFASAVWTGEEVVIWGGWNGSRERYADGAAYDPASASVHQFNRSDTPTAVAAAYDPASDRWRELPAPDLSPNGTFAVWTGEELFALDYGNVAMVYDPASDRWRDLPSPPTNDGESWPDFAEAEGEVFAWTFGGPAILDLQREEWEIPELPRRIRFGSLTPIAAGDALILLERTQNSEPPVDQLVYVPRRVRATPPPSSTLTVPDVIGLNYLSALGEVDSPFRLLESEYRDGAGYENGTIVEQDPAPGTEVLASETEIVIRVVVSVAPDERIRGTAWTLTYMDGGAGRSATPPR
jgi:hypothetical protein